MLFNYLKQFDQTTFFENCIFVKSSFAKHQGNNNLAITLNITISHTRQTDNFSEISDAPAKLILPSCGSAVDLYFFDLVAPSSVSS